MNDVSKMMLAHEDLTRTNVEPSEYLAIQGGRPGGAGQTFWVISSSSFAAYQAGLAEEHGFRVLFLDDEWFFNAH